MAPFLVYATNHCLARWFYSVDYFSDLDYLKISS